MPTANINKERLLRTVAQIINVIMVVSSYLLVTNDLLVIALAVFAASKWRMFATRVRLWPLNIRNSLCDIVFGLSIIVLMDYYYPLEPRLSLLLVAVLFGWQLVVKPMTSLPAVKLQSLLCMIAGTTAIWTLYPQEVTSGFIAVGSTLVVGYAAALHTIRQLPEEVLPEFAHNKLLAIWVYITGLFAWMSWLWNIQYSLQVSVFTIPQITLLLSLTFYFLGTILFFVTTDKADSRRSHAVRQILIYGALAGLIVGLSEWNISIQ